MQVGTLVGVMGLLAIVCVYFWLVRKKEDRQPSRVNAGPEGK
jgi:hypothetical protein